MPALPPGLVVVDELLLRGGVLLIYLAFVVLTAGALVLARWVKARGSLKLQPGLLSPLGSLYTLTTAFLLSNVIFQFTILRTALTEEVVTINKLGAVMSVLPVEQRIEARRLLYDYAESVAHDEPQAMLLGQRSEITQERMDRLRDFLASPDASLPEGGWSPRNPPPTWKGPATSASTSSMPGSGASRWPGRPSLPGSGWPLP